MRWETLCMCQKQLQYEQTIRPKWKLLTESLGGKMAVKYGMAASLFVSVSSSLGSDCFQFLFLTKPLNKSTCCLGLQLVCVFTTPFLPPTQIKQIAQATRVASNEPSSLSVQPQLLYYLHFKRGFLT